VTPENRRAYAEKHGYNVHVHFEHPMPNQGIHIQHSKLQLVADYLRSGDYDWVAWLDCDSIIMNMNRTLDSVIYRYARRSTRSSTGASVPLPLPAAVVEAEEAKGGAEGSPEDESEGLGKVQHSDAEPFEDEVLEAYVAHVGSCNSDEGCHMSARVRVNPRTSYIVSVRAAQIDMEQDSEKLSFVSVGGQSLGECNPHPENDYDCRLHSCFTGVEVPKEAVAMGVVSLEVQAVRTHSDCKCSRLHGICYSAALAAFEEATEGEKMTDPSYGAFVIFTFTPVKANATLPESAGGSDEKEEEPFVVGNGCSCGRPRPGTSLKPAPLPWTNWPSSVPGPKAAALRRLGAECEGPDILLGISVSLPLCLQLCREVHGCRFVAYGVGKKRGQCHWEVNECLSFEDDAYAVYDISPTLTQGSVDDAAKQLGCSSRCKLAGEDEEDQEPSFLPPEERGVDLLITEEGWGLSSANWMIRRSNWSIAFLERAFEVCHRDMPLFGDQDAMIHLLFNHRALSWDVPGDSLDPHAVIVPQRELNAYDALNAHYMGCDGFEEGDLLVTFPGCKDPGACNPIFNMAADYANGTYTLPPEWHQRDPTSLRLFGPPELAAELYQASRNL